MANESEEELEAKVAKMIKMIIPIEKELRFAEEKTSVEGDDWWSSIENAFRKPPEGKRQYGHKDGKTPVDLEAIARRALKRPHLPKLDPLSHNIVIAAESSPGFSSDLSRWNLTIDETGNLCQNILISTPENRAVEPYTENATIDADEVKRLLKLAIEMDFAHLNYSEDMMTDAGSSRLSIRLNGEWVTAVSSGYPLMTDESFERFRQLWQEIHRSAPFPKY